MNCAVIHVGSHTHTSTPLLAHTCTQHEHIRMGLFLLILPLDDDDPEDHGDSTPLQPGSLGPADGCSGQLATVT